MAEWGLSKARACAAGHLARARWYRPGREMARRDRDVREALNGVVEEPPRWGFWMCSHRLRLLGQGWPHKRVDRIYKAMKLHLPRRPKRRLPARVPQPMEVAARANAEWSMDCMAETRYQGRRFRTLNILDEGVHEALAIGIDPSSPGVRVVRTLAHLVQWRGKPDAIRVDNGPEYLSQVFTAWCQAQGVTLRYIQPGKPNQNASIERFNRTFRHAGLEADVVASLRQVRAITRHGITAYNEDRPHHSLGSIPPAMFRRQVEHARHST